MHTCRLVVMRPLPMVLAGEEAEEGAQSTADQGECSPTAEWAVKEIKRLAAGAGGLVTSEAWDGVVDPGGPGRIEAVRRTAYANTAETAHPHMQGDLRKTSTALSQEQHQAARSKGRATSNQVWVVSHWGEVDEKGYEALMKSRAYPGYSTDRYAVPMLRSRFVRSALKSTNRLVSYSQVEQDVHQWMKKHEKGAEGCIFGCKCLTPVVQVTSIVEQDGREWVLELDRKVQGQRGEAHLPMHAMLHVATDDGDDELVARVLCDDGGHVRVKMVRGASIEPGDLMGASPKGDTAHLARCQQMRGENTLYAKALSLKWWGVGVAGSFLDKGEGGGTEAARQGWSAW